MAKRGGTAIDVQLLARNGQFAHRDHRHRREGFIDLEQIDIVDRPARAIEHLANCRDWRGGEQGGRMGVRRRRDDARFLRQPMLLGNACPRQHQSGRTIGNRGGGGRSDRAILGEGGAQAWDLLRLGLARLLVFADDDIAAARLDRDRDHFIGKAATGDRRIGAAQAFNRESVLLGAGKLIGARRVLGKGPHRFALVIGIFQTVHHHRIDDDVMADACTRAVFGEQEGRIGHALHAACHHHIDGAGHQRFGRHDGRLHARAAHLVDRGRFHRLRQASAERRLARGCLAQACGQDAAHIDAVDAVRIHLRAFNRGLHCRRAEFDGGDARKRTLKAAHWRTRVAGDDDGVVGHRSSSQASECAC
ncbi:hypothetical protein D9M73_135040 [compost metagenome]